MAINSRYSILFKLKIVYLLNLEKKNLERETKLFIFQNIPPFYAIPNFIIINSCFSPLLSHFHIFTHWSQLAEATVLVCIDATARVSTNPFCNLDSIGRGSGYHQYSRDGHNQDEMVYSIFRSLNEINIGFITVLKSKKNGIIFLSKVLS